MTNESALSARGELTGMSELGITQSHIHLFPAHLTDLKRVGVGDAIVLQAWLRPRGAAKDELSGKACDVLRDTDM